VIARQTNNGLTVIGHDRWAAGRLTGTTLEEFLLADFEEAPHA